MSSLKVEERFVVDADVLRVWEFLKRPELVAGCLPGAKLEGQEGGNTFTGTMKVKVGPVMQDFRGKATLSEVDNTLRKMVISGVGDDKAGGGSARMTMNCQVVPAEGGAGSEVSIVADVELAGKLVRFGRGMFEAVAKQLFKQFVERARASIASMPAPAAGMTVESAPANAPAQATAATSEATAATSQTSGGTSEARAGTSEVSAGTSEVSAGTSEVSAGTSEVSAGTTTASPAPDKPSGSSSEVSAGTTTASPAPDKPSGSSSDASAAPSVVSAAPSVPSETASPASPRPASAPASPAPVLHTKSAVPAKASEDEALDAGSLIFVVIWEWIKGLFRRLLGRK